MLGDRLRGDASDRLGQGRIVPSRAESSLLVGLGAHVVSTGRLALVESTHPDPDLGYSAETPCGWLWIAGDSKRFSPLPDRLPDLRLLTPSDYDRAFLSNP